MKSPILTVGTPTYRRPEFLAMAVASALDSAGELTVEILVGDDDPEAFAASPNDERVQQIRRVSNLGCAANMNDLLARAKGRYFTWLQDDDWFAPGYLTRAVEYLEAHPDVAFYQGRYTTFEKEEDLLTLTDKPQERETILTGPELALKAFKEELPCMAFTGVYRTEMLRKVGGVLTFHDEKQPLTSEYLITLRMAYQGNAAWYDGAVVAWRVQPGKTHQADEFLDEWIRQSQDTIRSACDFLASAPLYEARELRASLFRLIGSILFYRVQNLTPRHRLGTMKELLRPDYGLSAWERFIMCRSVARRFLSREAWDFYMRAVVKMKLTFSPAP